MHGLSSTFRKAQKELRDGETENMGYGPVPPPCLQARLLSSLSVTRTTFTTFIVDEDCYNLGNEKLKLQHRSELENIEVGVEVGVGGWDPCSSPRKVQIEPGHCRAPRSGSWLM